MFTEKMFPDLSPEQRAQALQEQSFKVETQTVKRHYTPMDINQKKELLAENAMVTEDTEDMIKKLTAPLKERLKELKTSKKETVKQVKRGFEESVEEVYLFDDQDNNMMYEYDVEGNLLQTRKLAPSERQARIKQINKQA